MLSRAEFETRWPLNIVTLDVCRGLPFSDGAAAYVYSSMLIAELPREDGLALFRDVCRLLSPDGVFRILTTDLEILAREYLAGVERTHTPLTDGAPATRFLRRVGLGSERGPTVRQRLVWGATARRSRQWVYDEQSLTAALSDAGFRCERKGFLDSAIPGIEDVERHPFTDVLCLECTKR